MHGILYDFSINLPCATFKITRLLPAVNSFPRYFLWRDTGQWKAPSQLLFRTSMDLSLLECVLTSVSGEFYYFGGNILLRLSFC